MPDIKTLTAAIRGATLAIDEQADVIVPPALPDIYIKPGTSQTRILAYYTRWLANGGNPPDDGAEPGEEPDEPEPPPTPNTGRFPPGPLLFSESRPPQMHEIPRALVMSLSRHRAKGPFPIACWHPWYAPEHGTGPGSNAPKFAKASGDQIKAWLAKDIDLAVRNGYRAWGVDWEGALLQSRLIGVMEQLSIYARSRGLLVVHVPKSNMDHHVPAMWATRDTMAQWCNRWTDGIALWGWGLDVAAWRVYTGALWGLLWPRGDQGRGDAAAKVAWARAHGPQHRVWCGLNNPGQLGPAGHQQPEVIRAVKEAWG